MTDRLASLAYGYEPNRKITKEIN